VVVVGEVGCKKIKMKYTWVVVVVGLVLISLALMYMNEIADKHASQNELLLEKINSLSQQLDSVQYVMRPSQANEYNKLLEEGRKCLLLNTTKAHKQCWADMRRKVWLAELDKLEELSPANRAKFKQPIYRWQPFELLPSTYDCDYNNIRRVGGDGDGGKWICEPLFAKSGCVIVSIGSNGNFEFERGMKAFTQDKCKLYTFDCTGNWKDDSTEFHPWCVGGKDFTDSDGRIYKRLSTIVNDLKLTGISYLKMDVEGAEWQVLPDILRESNEVALPNQISFELHTYKMDWMKTKDGDWMEPMIWLGRLIDSAGYRVAIAERNTLCTFCSEYIIVKSPLYETGN